MPWLLALPIVGLLIVSVGVYAAGGDEVTCARMGAAAESTSAPFYVECRAETRRWLGLRAVSVQDYRGITGIEAIAEATTTTGAPRSVRSGGSPETRGGGGDDWSLRLLSKDGEIGRIRGPEGPVSAAAQRLREWIASGASRPVRVSLSSWAFSYAAMGFGALWTLVTGFLVKLAAQQSARERADREAASP